MAHAALALAAPPPAAPLPAPSPDATATVLPLRRKRGPKTPEGKARSRMNALKHGLRAELLPLPPAGEDAAHFAELVEGLRATYRPEDTAEAGMVEAIAVAMWQEIKADRLEAEALVALAGGEGRAFHGGVLLESAANRATLHTVLRYQATASCAVGRAMRQFHAHRRAKRDGLLLPPFVRDDLAEEAAGKNHTNELSARARVADDRPAPDRAVASAAVPQRPKRTNELLASAAPAVLAAPSPPWLGSPALWRAAADAATPRPSRASG